MALVGIFDPDLAPLSWFDPDLYPLAWWDHDLIGMDAAAFSGLTPLRNTVFVGSDDMTTLVRKDGITVYVQAEDVEADS